jgi:hypothetical protein
MGAVSDTLLGVHAIYSWDENFFKLFSVFVNSLVRVLPFLIASAILAPEIFVTCIDLNGRQV